MAEHHESFKQTNGMIDFDHYRAEAARLRKQARDDFVWRVAAPFFWRAPARLAASVLRLMTARIGLARVIGSGSGAGQATAGPTPRP